MHTCCSATCARPITSSGVPPAACSSSRSAMSGCTAPSSCTNRPQATAQQSFTHQRMICSSHTRWLLAHGRDTGRPLHPAACGTAHGRPACTAAWHHHSAAPVDACVRAPRWAFCLPQHQAQSQSRQVPVPRFSCQLLHPSAPLVQPWRLEQVFPVRRSGCGVCWGSF